MYFSGQREVCEASTISKTENGQVENILSSKFLSFSNHCSHFMYRKVCTLYMVPVREQGADIFISVKPERFCMVLLPVAEFS